MALAAYTKPKKPLINLQSNLAITLFFINVVFTVLALLFLNTSTNYNYTNHSPNGKTWSGDLRYAEFAWNKLRFDDANPPPTTLKIAVFSRKWPTTTTPGGMERHARILHTILASRGHQVHVFTSPPTNKDLISTLEAHAPVVHWHDGEPEKWRPNKAWEQFQEEDSKAPFDVIHSESVSLPYLLARGVENVAVSWHGIALENLQSFIYQDLIRQPNEPISPAFNQSLQNMLPKVLNEIRFFSNYAHHVATSDSCGEMLRDVYQIPTKRVHVIVNGVKEDDYVQDVVLGQEFRSKIGVPKNTRLVLGVSGRLVRDKGHPLLYEAFSRLKAKHPDVYLIVVGSGPWMHRYKEMGSQVKVLGSMNPTELRAFYNAIDIFLNPTLRPQGLDQTQLEAMMSGSPVMLSRLPSIKGTIVVDDEFGFMFSPNVQSLYEALELAVAEGAKRMSQRGKACREYAASIFTARKMAMAYERLFLCIKDQTYCMYP